MNNKRKENTFYVKMRNGELRKITAYDEKEACAIAYHMGGTLEHLRKVPNRIEIENWIKEMKNVRNNS